MTLPPRIGRYQVLELLGQGAMGVVYRARDEGLDRDVAVKVIRGESLDDQSRAQFLKEARAAARMQHPGIVTVYELGEEGGAPFLVMELLEGVDLQRAMRERLVASPERALAVIEQVLGALGHAHARGIVHRDMKPSNVFLHARTHAKILDFGVARLGEGLTVTGRIVGTPHYMSPEQIRADPVDGRTDLFSTALMFYEMVTGAKCYRPGSAVSVMYQIVHEDADLSRLPETPAGAALRAVLRRALARDRGDRYPNAASLFAALAEAVRETAAPPTAARAPGAPTIVDAPSRPRPEDKPPPAPVELDLPLSVSASEPRDPAPPAGQTGRRVFVPAALGSVLVAGGVAWWWLATQRPPPGSPMPASIGPLPARPPTTTAASIPSVEPSGPPASAPVSPPAPEPVASPVVAPPTAAPLVATPTTRPSLVPATEPSPAPLPTPTRSARPPASPPAGDASESRLDRAERLFQSGQLRAALAEARAVLRDDPGNTEAKYLADDIQLDLTVEDHVRKARAALARGDRDTARAEAEAGLGIKPNESRLTALLRELGRP